MKEREREKAKRSGESSYYLLAVVDLGPTLAGEVVVKETEEWR